MENFTPLASLVGGMLIGTSASLLMLFNGRIAGISGIFGGLVTPQRHELAWRAAFVAGLLAGGAVMFALRPELFSYTLQRSWWAVALAGALVGVGSRLGSGCTSGHGVCGLSRTSGRSLVSVIVFMSMAVLVVFVIQRAFGGAL